MLRLSTGGAFHSDDLGDQAQRLSQHLAAEETALQELLTEENPFDRGAVASGTILRFDGDSITHWTSNTVLPDRRTAEVACNGKAIRLKNGYYGINCHQSEGQLTVGLFPIRSSYPIQNSYLTNRFVLSGIHGGIELDSLPGSHRVTSANDRTLFYLTPLQGEPVRAVGFRALLFAIGCVFLLLFLNKICLRISPPILAVAILSVSFASFKWLALGPLRPGFLGELGLFDPQTYATPAFATSLGDLLVLVVLLVWVAVFMYRHVWIGFRGKAMTVVAPIVAGALSGGALLISSDIVRTLVSDSNISFDVHNFLSLNIYSLLGLALVGLLFVGVLLFAHKLGRLARAAQPNDMSYFLLVMAGALIALLVLAISRSPLLGWPAAVGLILFTVMVSVFSVLRVPVSGFNALIFLLAFFSVYTAVLVYGFNLEKELGKREVYAKKLLETNDPVVEFLFSDIRTDLQDDNLIRSYFTNPVISTRSIVDRLTFLYFGDHLNRYDVSVYAYPVDSIAFRTPQDLTRQELVDYITDNGAPTGVRDLSYVATPDGSFEYWALLQVADSEDQLLGQLGLRFLPKSIVYSNVYPELLLEGGLSLQDDLTAYDYAIYSGGTMVKRSGNFAYQLRTSTEDEGMRHYEGEGYSHLVYSPNQDLSVWVSRPLRTRLEPVSLFSYVFCIFLLVVLSVYLFGLGKRISRKGFDFSGLGQLSFQSKIQLVVTLIIVLSFLVIGTLTVFNITRQYDVYHQERLMRKVKQVITGIELQYGDELAHVALDPVGSGLAEKVGNLSVTHSMDINMYNTRGHLVVSSQPGIFERGLISSLINPLALHELTMNNRSQFVQNERIGKLEYLSAYVPLGEKAGDFDLVLNLPYFAKEKNLQSEISDFLIYFIDVYVLLLVVAGIIALVVSKSVTRPLSVIGSKLKQVRIGMRNEPISWQGTDEIGQLVSEYNKMIRELERSADLLAQSERESAWREMAQQVAHEIKNPLTPMKLSIQQLQRAQHEGRPDLNEQVKRVSATLIEQIENLSRIASEFSSFAKMPQAEKERIDLHENLRSIITLYQHDEVEVSAEIPKQPAPIFADKGQIGRVFHNLINNAIQAIPEGRLGLVEVKSEQNADSVTVTITDNGVGISDDQQRRVFVPNFTTKTSGTGLGLAIAKNIVESSGGRIFFESVEGVGTEFFVTLPLMKTTTEL